MIEAMDDEQYETMKQFCAQGDRFAELGDYETALNEYDKAWKLIPEPQYKWNASTWILAAVADASYLAGYNTSALEALQYAMLCPNAIGNPFLHLRLGQVLYEKGEMDRSADELMRAYMGGGEEIFEKEDKYFLEFLKTRAKI